MSGTEILLRVDRVLFEHLDEYIGDVFLGAARELGVIAFVAGRRRREHDEVAVRQSRLTVGGEVMLKRRTSVDDDEQPKPEPKPILIISTRVNRILKTHRTLKTFATNFVV